MSPAPTIDIRPEAPPDSAAIRALNDAAFGGPAEGRVIDGVRGTEDWLPGGSMVAVDREGRIVGHVLLSRGRLTAADGQEWIVGMIGPVAVAPEMQRQGIGGALMRAAIARATELGLPLLCLLGHSDYYPRFGFEPARALGIEPPEAWPDEAWMVRRLPGWRPEMRGVARYAPSFGAG